MESLIKKSKKEIFMMIVTLVKNWNMNKTF